MEKTLASDRLSLRNGLWGAGVYGFVTLLLYYETVWSMVSIWSRSETFAHGFLVLPITLWLIWNRREQLVLISPVPAPRLALLLIPLGLVWLLAWLVDVTVIKQLALVATLIAGAWAVMGYQLAGALTFPLFFLFFAVPMGEGLIAPMMEFTATSTVWMVEMTGIPVYREGLYFSLPSGNWSVVEACSGVRYIIASVTVGSLYAYLTYYSWSRRILFVLVSAIVPIFANSVRAYIIVMLGHVSNMKVATGADHLVYGWAFFGVVIFVLFWLGSFFREDHLPPPQQPAPSVSKRTVPATRGMLSLTVVVTLLCASVAPAVAWLIALNTPAQTQLVVRLPEARGVWQPSTTAHWQWRPISWVSGQSSAYYQVSGETLGVFVQYADGVIPDAEVIGSSTTFTTEESSIRIVGRASVPVQVPGGEVLVAEVQLSGPDQELVAWSWYLVGEFSTADNYRAKLQQIASRLGIGRPGVYRIVLATPLQSSMQDTRARLQSFVVEHAAPMYIELQRAAAEQP